MLVEDQDQYKDATNQVRPTAMMEAAPSQPWAFKASLNQKPNNAQVVQVRRSTGVTSQSTFDHLSGSAKVDFCLGMTQAEGFLFAQSRCRKSEDMLDAGLTGLIRKRSLD